VTGSATDETDDPYRLFTTSFDQKRTATEESRETRELSWNSFKEARAPTDPLSRSLRSGQARARGNSLAIEFSRTPCRIEWTAFIEQCFAFQ